MRLRAAREGCVANFAQKVLKELSLSRFNHWRPRSQAPPAVMPGTAACHHDIAAAVRPQTDPVCDPAPALDPPVARRDPPPASAPGPVVASAASAWRLGGVGTPTR